MTDSATDAQLVSDVKRWRREISFHERQIASLFKAIEYAEREAAKRGIDLHAV